MSSIRPRVSARLGRFVRLITTDLPGAYGLELQGSWAYGEYHAIEESGIIRSYSDVDFICNLPLAHAERESAEAELYKAATSCGLRLRGISIRPAKEMRDMWTLGARASDKGASGEIQSEFIRFWILVGAAEVCAAWARNADCAPLWRHYHLNKFFLSIWRDLSIVSGRRLRSYSEILLFAAAHLSPDICGASYALKLGLETAVPWDRVQLAHQSKLLAQLRCFIRSAPEFESVCRTVDEITRLDCNAARFLALELLGAARNLEGDVTARRAARARLIHKLTQGA